VPRERWFGIGFFALCLGWTLWPLRHAYRGVDFRWLYAAGSTWLAGHSPYDIPAWSERFPYTDGAFSISSSTAPFVYPPHWAVFAVPLALLPYPAAIRVWDVLNVAAHLGSLWLCWKLIDRSEPSERRRTLAWILCGFATLSGSVRFALWEPQMSVLPTFGIVGAYWASKQRGNLPLLVGFVFLASLKPQLSALPLAFLMFNGGAKGVLGGGVLAVAAALAALVPFDVSKFPEQFVEGYRLHLASPFNVPSNFTHLGGLLSAATGPRWLWLLLPSGIIAGWIALRAGKRWAGRLQAVHLLALTCALTPLLFPLHIYDLVLYSPVLVALAAARVSVWTVLTVLCAEVAARADFVGLTNPALPLLPLVALLVVGFLGAAVWPRVPEPAKVQLA
jgi:alpha-1,2-mannosyltransferase